MAMIALQKVSRGDPDAKEWMDKTEYHTNRLLTNVLQNNYLTPEVKEQAYLDAKKLLGFSYKNILNKKLAVDQFSTPLLHPENIAWQTTPLFKTHNQVYTVMKSPEGIQLLQELKIDPSEANIDTFKRYQHAAIVRKLGN
jgi:hypothetical protein